MRGMPLTLSQNKGMGKVKLPSPACFQAFRGPKEMGRGRQGSGAGRRTHGETATSDQTRTEWQNHSFLGLSLAE